MSRRLHLLAVFALAVAPVLASSPRPAADELATIVQALEPAAVAGHVPDILAARLACLRLLSGSPAPDRVPLIRYTVAYAAWRVAFSPGVSAKDQTALLDDGAVQLEAAIKADGRFAEAMGLLGAVDGAKIAHAPELGMTLGPESSAILEPGARSRAEQPAPARLPRPGAVQHAARVWRQHQGRGGDAAARVAGLRPGARDEAVAELGPIRRARLAGPGAGDHAMTTPARARNTRRRSRSRRTRRG